MCEHVPARKFPRARPTADRTTNLERAGPPPMQHTQREQPSFFVVAAMVAARLDAVMKTARQISLSAANAKAMSERAGESARGFRPITVFIDEMGRETTRLVTAINASALEISQAAVMELRLADAAERMERAQSRLDVQPANLVARRAEIDDATVKHQQRRQLAQQRLTRLLDDIVQQMRATSIVSTRARVEATRVGALGTYLNSVVELVDRAAADIRAAVSECETWLRAS